MICWTMLTSWFKRPLRYISDIFLPNCFPSLFVSDTKNHNNKRRVVVYIFKRNRGTHHRRTDSGVGLERRLIIFQIKDRKYLVHCSVLRTGTRQTVWPPICTKDQMKEDTKYIAKCRQKSLLSFVTDSSTILVKSKPE